MHVVSWSAPRDRRPTVVFCHGFPGLTMHEEMLDALRARGYGVLVFRYRGAFGAPGDYSFPGSIADVATAVGDARARTRSPIALLGYSTGGFYVTTAVARDATLADAVILLGAASDLPRMWKHWDRRAPDALGTYYREGGGHLRGDAARRYAEACAMRDGPQPRDLVARFRVPLLVLHGTRDDDAPFDMAEDLVAHAPSGTRFVSYDTDHDFVGVQLDVARDIATFLDDAFP
ncbi:MAG: alpha/beta hydrolase [Thermoplasmatota archaeon]